MSEVVVSGKRIHVVDKGRGRPLLLVHGFPLDHTMWSGQIERLSKEYRILAPDLRGFGQSDFAEGNLPMERFADDLAAVLDALDIEQPVAFCGLSMGGYIAWQFWRRHSDRLDRLILCDTRAIADSPEAAIGRRETAERVLREGASVLVESLLPKLFADATHQRNPEVVAATRRVIERTDRRSIAAALLGMADRPDVTSWLPSIKLPTLVLCGQMDAISTVAEMRNLASALPAARFVEITNAGHMAPLERPVVVNAAIDEFLGDN